MRKFSLAGLVKTIVLIVVLWMPLGAATASAQSLVGRVWQLQNPALESLSSIIQYHDNGTFNCSMLNLKTGITTYSAGTYRASKQSLTIMYSNGMSFTYSLVWYNRQKVEMTIGDFVYIYAERGSYYDTWYFNYSNSISSLYQENPTSYSPELGFYTPVAS